MSSSSNLSFQREETLADAKFLKTVSMTLSSILRHGNKDTDKVKLQYDNRGYVPLDKLIEKLKTSGKKFEKVNSQLIFKVVAENEKKRFKIVYKDKTKCDTDNCVPPDTSLSSGSYLICATQGHSDKVAQFIDPTAKYETVTTPYPILIHGTTFKAWDLIQQSKGLSRMQRSHIHFVCNEPNAKEVVSGFRTDVELKLYVDMKSAMQDGIIFYRSENNVILTDGIDGVLPIKYIYKVSRQHE